MSSSLNEGSKSEHEKNKGYIKVKNMLPTIQVDISDTTLNHHWYRLSRILSDGVKPSVLWQESSRKLQQPSCQKGVRNEFDSNGNG